ncbi:MULTISPECIES: anti-sigma factor family protein [unclassified Streptomyces]|uniref:anti-sigma factor family protein n=1 Tax=unclassified Streptomyces TaxID=2593676 RepID=UPI003810D04A
MTSPAGTNEHPEVAEISDFTEGILPPQRSASIRGHLDGCPLCADVRDSLEEIRGLLGTLPGPPRMPADIAGRIDAALAAEVLLDSTAPDVSRETSPVVAATHVSRETSHGAGRGPEGRAAATTGPGRPPVRTRRRWHKGLLLTVSAMAVLGLGGLAAALVESSSGQTDMSANADTKDSAAVAGQPDERAEAADPLRTQVQQLLSGGTANRPQNNSAAESPLMDVNGMPPSCVLRAIGRPDDGTPLASRRGAYEGSDSYLVVLPHPGDRSLVDAFVVDASCTAATPSATGTLLREETYPR